MKQKLLFTTFLFFFPVLNKFITAQPLHLVITSVNFEVMVILSIIVLLLIVRIATVIYFWISVINWISSGFKIVKLIPCVISFVTIFCIDYSIEAILNAIIKRIKNKIQRIPEIVIQRNRQLLKDIPL